MNKQRNAILVLLICFVIVTILIIGPTIVSASYESAQNLDDSPNIYLPLVLNQYPPVPPEHYEGSSPNVSFDVISNQVCNFRLEIPFMDTTCSIHPTSCAEITNDGFRFEFYYPVFDITDNINGEFDSSTHASGDWMIKFCGNIYFIAGETGTWEASKISQ
jgi:hypothetical protein